MISKVGPGWRKLVEPIVAKAAEEGVTIFDIKEKFGALRVYTAPGSDALENMIDRAEDTSRCTCEFCGKSGSLRTERRWFKTLCDECDKSEA